MTLKELQEFNINIKLLINTTHIQVKGPAFLFTTLHFNTHCVVYVKTTHAFVVELIPGHFLNDIH